MANIDGYCGNPYFEIANERLSGDNKGAYALLALAHEQRTANLLEAANILRVSGHYKSGDDVLDEAMKELGYEKSVFKK